MPRNKRDHKERLEARRQRQEHEHLLVVDPAGLPAEPSEGERAGQPPRASADIRTYEPALHAMRRYLARHGVDPTDTDRAGDEDLIADGTWLDEPLPETATPLERAQELIFDAWGTDDPDEQLALADEALELSADCADAWVIFGEQAGSPKEARTYYQKGVAAGKRALGGAVPTEPIDSTWDLLPVLPWMRAKQGVAAADRALGEPNRAADLYRELLAIDPHDTLNIRLSLSAALLEAGRDEEQLALADRFADEANIYWPWIRALARFRMEGESDAAVEALDRAVERNPWVPAYLLGIRRIGNDMLIDVERSQEAREGSIFVMVALTQWLLVPGALEWVRRRAGDAARATVERELTA